MPWEVEARLIQERHFLFQSLRSGGSIALGLGGAPLALLAVVSILVLVEVLPWDQLLPPLNYRPSTFQSLFWWKYCPGLRRKPCDEHVPVRFQSLFWWKYCPGNDLESAEKAQSNGFQSLFWWKYCPGLSRGGLMQLKRQCFNPCSGGSIALGSWLTPAPGCRTGVSILVLVEVLPWVHGRSVTTWTPWTFQSLFWWKYCPGSKHLKYKVVGPKKVSILVLVEVLPWVCGGCKAAGWPSIGFNPCSGGSIALGYFRRFSACSWRSSFNPCSGGSIALGP